MRIGMGTACNPAISAGPILFLSPMAALAVALKSHLWSRLSVKCVACVPSVMNALCLRHTRKLVHPGLSTVQRAGAYGQALPVTMAVTLVDMDSRSSKNEMRMAKL
jgi:hypothetical protein